MFRTILPAWSLLLLCACMPGRIDRVHVGSSYAPEQYHRVPYSHILVADVSGNPFSIEQAEFNSRVGEAIQPYRGAPPARTGDRVRLAFNGPVTTSEDYACKATGGAGNSGGDIHLVAAFCSGSNQAVTYLVGSVSGITGPDDPQFASFVRWAVVELFPPPSNDERRDSFCFWPDC